MAPELFLVAFSPDSRFLVTTHGPYTTRGPRGESVINLSPTPSNLEELRIWDATCGHPHRKFNAYVFLVVSC